MSDTASPGAAPQASMGSVAPGHPGTEAPGAPRLGSGVRKRAQVVASFHADEEAPGKPLWLMVPGGTLALACFLGTLAILYFTFARKSVATATGIPEAGGLFVGFTVFTFVFSYGYHLYDLRAALKLTAIIVVSALSVVIIVAALFALLSEGSSSGSSSSKSSDRGDSGQSSGGSSGSSDGGGVGGWGWWPGRRFGRGRRARAAPRAPQPAVQARPASSPPPTSFAAAWYPDPWRTARVRYWDGDAWTGYVA